MDNTQPTPEQAATVERAMSMLEGMADAWMVETKIDAFVRRVSAIFDPKERHEAIDALIRQAWIEAAYRGFTTGKDMKATESAKFARMASACMDPKCAEHVGCAIATIIESTIGK